MLTSRAVPYKMLSKQWKFFPTSMQQTLLGVVTADVVRMCEKAGQQVQCVKETVYEVDVAELQLYPE